MKKAATLFSFLLTLLFAWTTFAAAADPWVSEEGRTGSSMHPQGMHQGTTGTMQSQGAQQGFQGERNLVSVHDLLGKNVTNHEGENLGQINNVMLDPASGRIAYVTLGTGGGFTASDMKLIPYQAFDVTPDGVSLVISKDKLAQVPSFSQEQGIEQFDRQVIDFYGVSPYWEE